MRHTPARYGAQRVDLLRVSIEVSPGAAHKASDERSPRRAQAGAVVERPKVMRSRCRAPPAGEAAARRLLADGINVNITLLFAIDAYAVVIESYITAAREERAKRGLPLSAIASVASFFVSRVDTEVDKRLDGARRRRIRARRGGEGLSRTRSRRQCEARVRALPGEILRRALGGARIARRCQRASSAPRRAPARRTPPIAMWSTSRISSALT